MSHEKQRIEDNNYAHGLIAIWNRDLHKLSEPIKLTSPIYLSID